MKQLLFGILFIVINIGIAASDFNMPLQGINYNLEECNKLDKAGQKTGIWIYEYPEMVIVSYYSIGKKMVLRDDLSNQTIHIIWNLRNHISMEP